MAGHAWHVFTDFGAPVFLRYNERVLYVQLGYKSISKHLGPLGSYMYTTLRLLVFCLLSGREDISIVALSFRNLHSNTLSGRCSPGEQPMDRFTFHRVSP